MSKTAFLLLLAFFLLPMPAPAHAQTKPTQSNPAFSTLLPVLRQELGETPQLILWADAKSLRASAFYTGAANTVESLFQKATASSKCLKKMKFSEFDQALLLGSELESAKERGYLAISGSFDAAKLLKCLASEFNWTRNQVGGTVVYQETSGSVKSSIFAAGKNAFVLVAGTWAKPVTPGSGTLGNGTLAGFTGSNVLAAKYDPPAGQDFKALEGTATAASDLSLKGFVLFNRTKDAIDLQKKADSAKQQLAVAGLPLSKSLKIVRTNKRIDAEAGLTTSEFVMLLTLLENAMGNSNANPSSPPPSPGPSNAP